MTVHHKTFYDRKSTSSEMTSVDNIVFLKKPQGTFSNFKTISKNKNKKGSTTVQSIGDEDNINHFEHKSYFLKQNPTRYHHPICPQFLSSFAKTWTTILLHYITLLLILSHFYLIIIKCLSLTVLLLSTRRNTHAQSLCSVTKQKKEKEMLDPANEMLPPPSSPTISSVSSSDLDTEVYPFS